MPQVPRRTERDIVPRPVPDTQVGRGGQVVSGPIVNQIARQGQEILGTLADYKLKKEAFDSQIAQKARDEVDTIVSLEADSKLQARQYEIESEVKNYRGKNSPIGRDVGNEMWGKAVEDIEKGLSNETQRRTFRATAGKRYLMFKKSTEMHISGELEKWATATHQNSINSAIADAVENAYDPRFIQGQTMNIAAIEQYFADKNGLGDETANAKTAAALSEMHSKILRRMIADGRLGAANEHRKKYGELIQGPDMAQIEKLTSEMEKAANEQLNRNQWRLQNAVEKGNIGPRNLDDLWEAQVKGTGPRYFESYNDVVKFKDNISKTYNSKLIPADQKLERWKILMEEFAKLPGAEINENGEIIKASDEIDAASQKRFRELLASSKDHMTKDMYNKLLFYSSPEFTPDREQRMAWWKRFTTRLNQVNAAGAGYSSAFMAGLLAIFNPDISPKAANAKADDIIRGYQAKENINGLLYDMDKRYTLPDGTVGVYRGNNEYGEPLFEYGE